MRLNRLMHALGDSKAWFKGGAAFVLSILLLGALSSQCHFVVSETDSLPQHYFLVFPHIKPKLHDYTVVYSPWYGEQIIKQIMGQAGDRLRWDEQGALWINDFKIGTAQKKSYDHRELRPIITQVIPKHYVFLWGPHPRSFDSRYQECALIRSADLGGWVIPLW
jgi:Signal peptidase, peptidase S26